MLLVFPRRGAAFAGWARAHDKDKGVRAESNRHLLVHSQPCRNRYTTDAISGEPRVESRLAHRHQPRLHFQRRSRWARVVRRFDTGWATLVQLKMNSERAERVGPSVS